jgi:hypothetical protein
MGCMAVGESVKSWDTSPTPSGNSALPIMGAMTGGPYITSSTRGITTNSTEKT